jgi:para-aminobenzoate synthetase component I
MLQPWFWRQLPLQERTASEIFAAVFLPQHHYPLATLLESPYPASPDCPQLSRYSICAIGPRTSQQGMHLWTPAIGNILPFLRQLLNSTQMAAIAAEERGWPELPLNADLPFTGGWLGWLGYDLAWEIEQIPILKTDALPFPISCWYEPEVFAVLDHQDQSLWIAATTVEQLTHAEQCLMVDMRRDPEQFGSPVQHLLNFHCSQADYEAMVRQAQHYIRAGDIFQANLSMRFSAQTNWDSWLLYRTFHQINPAPFSSYWRTPWGAIISGSPERLVTLQGQQIQTRPIAGTRPRGRTVEQDQALMLELKADPKEQAEHIMLVDLERNDLGRVCNWGTVHVNELLSIERYSHVMHLVSNIVGQLRDDCNAIDLIQAVFPGGTITGCPKVRCLEIIEELERSRRNLFYGSCGYLDWRGNLDLNILIRTLLWEAPQKATKSQPYTVWGQVGAGIVADSIPEQEWNESLNKAQAQLAALATNQLPAFQCVRPV